ncbi:esterase/lipase family protein [Streptomyces sp. NPDC059095]|uniref:esterase/lipase family protein n=1 Tax=Streptomyces sp. NPDC059095 TaxID=3346726 RepID=UPI0036AA2320
MPQRFGAPAVAAALCSLALLAAVAPASAAQGGEHRPDHHTVVGALAATAVSPATANSRPPGAHTDPTRPCPPGADRQAHPRPVVLVHGTAENAYDNWNVMAPALANAGYCVYAINYGATGPLTALGAKATGPIEDSAKELAAYVDRVLRTTGARKVDLVGHSQGAGPMPRQYLKFEGGAAKVHRLVGLAPDNHGTTVSGLGAVLRAVAPVTDVVLGPAALEQVAGSRFLARLNEGGDTRPGVKYTVVATTYDKVVTPYTSGFLTAPADDPAAVTNLTLQDVCPGDSSGHVALSYSPNAVNLTLDALDPAHRATWTCENVLAVPPLP